MLLVDTNVWLAAGDGRSSRHADCSRLISERAGELAAPVPVIAETAWLLLDRVGTDAQVDLVAMITTGRLEPIELT